MENVGSKIREHRVKKGISLRELGRRINIAYSYLSRIENNKQNPHIDLLESIANALDVKLADFFIDESKSNFTDEEKDLISEKTLTPEELKKKYNFEIEKGKPATDKEIEMMVNYVLFLRSQNTPPS